MSLSPCKGKDSFVRWPAGGTRCHPAEVDRLQARWALSELRHIQLPQASRRRRCRRCTQIDFQTCPSDYATEMEPRLSESHEFDTQCEPRDEGLGQNGFAHWSAC